VNLRAKAAGANEAVSQSAIELIGHNPTTTQTFRLFTSSESHALVPLQLQVCDTMSVRSVICAFVIFATTCRYINDQTAIMALSAFHGTRSDKARCLARAGGLGYLGLVFQVTPRGRCSQRLPTERKIYPNLIQAQRGGRPEEVTSATTTDEKGTRGDC